MTRNSGTVRIAPSVLAAVAQLTTLSIEGVTCMADDPTTRLYRMLSSGSELQGVRLDVSDDAVAVDLYIIACHGVNLQELGREIQARVTRAIREIVGMAVRNVNVHIQDNANPQEH